MLPAIIGGIEAISRLSGLITNITKAIADTKIATINAATEKERIAGNEKVKALEAERDVLIAQMTSQAQTIQVSLAQVNETMREELKPENRHWFFTGWRPAAGWVFVIFAAAFGVLLVGAGMAAIAGSADALKALTEAWPLYAAYLAALAAMVGVYVIARSSDKIKGVDTSARSVKPR